MKEILYIANYPFPSNAAYATRILNFCRIFNNLGYSCTVISHKGNKAIDNNIKNENINIISFAPYVSSFRVNIRNFMISKYALANILEDYLENHRPEVIILGGGYSRLFRYVNSFGRKKKIPVIVEACEWYDWTQIALGPLSPMFWDNRLALWYFYKKADAFIGISRYLQNYYNECGIFSLRVPTILDTKKYLFSTLNPNDNRIVITYAGYPAKKKDFIDQVIIALAKRRDLQRQIKLRIIGPDIKKIVKLLGRNSSALKDAGSCVEILGKRNHNEINEYLINSDFTILLRPNKRYANAGFPTKVAESMAAGIPVISNLTGDIGLYLKDMENGIICNGYTADDCIESLEKAVLLSKKELLTLKKNARKTAENNFDYRVYIKELSDLMHYLKNYNSKIHEKL